MVEKNSAHTFGGNVSPGARSVLNRVIKEDKKVPVFIAQTMAESMRDLGYNNTTSAICELADNAIQADATEIRVYFNERGRGKKKELDVLVYDNGTGMAPNFLQLSAAFGGGTRYNDRNNIGRYGVGMKSSCLGMGPAFYVYSWQEPEAVYCQTFDLDEIRNSKLNVVYLDPPTLQSDLDDEVLRVLSSYMRYPTDKENQERLIDGEYEIWDDLGDSGTVVYIPDCDRLSYKLSKTLVDHATKDMARIYRKFMSQGIDIYINNRPLIRSDPLFLDGKAKHIRDLDRLEDEEGYEVNETVARDFLSKEVLIHNTLSGQTHPVNVRLVLLPPEWHDLPRKRLKGMGVFDHGVSVLRGDREVYLGHIKGLTQRRDSRGPWHRMEIQFPADLDEEFGVTVNKQGIRISEEVVKKIIASGFKEALNQVREEIKKRQAERNVKKNTAKISEAERRATDAEVFQTTILPEPDLSSPEGREKYKEHLEVLASEYRQEDESLDEAKERIEKIRFLTKMIHNEDMPFYRMDYNVQTGKVLLKINTAHPFYSQVYEPLIKLNRSGIVPDNLEESDNDETVFDATQIISGLQMMLFALARTQVSMQINDQELEKVFVKLRQQWSINLDTLLSTPVG
ncbi:ATP-binding protein [Desulfobacterales bacterium HSG2]|nr:ATP-binding protein [Desulfobacterales bacterium HSG2]